MLLTSTEMAEKWDISARRISLLCSEGRLEGAFKKGKTWQRIKIRTMMIVMIVVI